MKITIQTFLVLIGLSLFSCENKNIIKTHENLLDWQSEFVMEDCDDEGYYDDYENFTKPYFSENQNKDTLIVTSLMQVNACGYAIGNINFSNDTLFLETKETAEELCTCIKYCKYTYKIYNPEKQKYTIISER